MSIIFSALSTNFQPLLGQVSSEKPQSEADCLSTASKRLGDAHGAATNRLAEAQAAATKKGNDAIAAALKKANDAKAAAQTIEESVAADRAYQAAWSAQDRVYREEMSAAVSAYNAARSTADRAYNQAREACLQAKGVPSPAIKPPLTNWNSVCEVRGYSSMDQTGRLHGALDVNVPVGTPVLAPMDGRVAGG